MVTELKGLEFDPGFGPYILAFRGSVEYLYADIIFADIFRHTILPNFQRNCKMSFFLNLRRHFVQFEQKHRFIYEVQP